jgi:hypothetical protein
LTVYGSAHKVLGPLAGPSGSARVLDTDARLPHHHAARGVGVRPIAGPALPAAESGRGSLKTEQ